uniref:PPFIA binding protein 2 n=1 Tax=Takifugu rubripes TaxID=31033 RepID=A0A674MNJ8_TAKRU
MEHDIDFYKHFGWLKKVRRVRFPPSSARSWFWFWVNGADKGAAGGVTYSSSSTFVLKVNASSSANGESYQQRLSRLEGDKESLILQVSVLTDQVEAQGAKISDLKSSLVEHQQKLRSAGEMLQQEFLHRTSLESQKLSLMGEVSYLKLKLSDMEGKQGYGAERQHKAENIIKELRTLKEKVEHLEDQKLQGGGGDICHFEDCLGKKTVPETGQTCPLYPPHHGHCCAPTNTQGRHTHGLCVCVCVPTAASGDSGESERSISTSSRHFLPYFADTDYSRLRRTQSGGFQSADPEAAPFKRGGLRATAGPRLTRTPEASASSRDMSVPFSQWTKEQVCGWLEDFGLGQYVNLTRQWVESGQTLLSATPQDLEKEMRMRNPLHRKKLQLALRAFSTKTVEKSSELDYIWVARWLDDIGLPQYKDQFHEARVDGRMIQYLTVNDLLSLKVTSQLHHLSIKCAIHVLHANKFNPNCLRRRPGEERNPSPSEVVQWSNHRVMEWLRSADLAEFAPNLRGSGVHGGLIILEPRFSSETLALLLNIPPQKTLLRRHLATAFSALVGAQAAQEKREYANATGHVPLTTTAKVKPKKLGFTQFSHLRKRKQDDSLDYICPMDTGAVAVNGGSPPPSAALKGLSPPRQADQQEDEVETGAQTGSKH